MKSIIHLFKKDNIFVFLISILSSTISYSLFNNPVLSITIGFLIFLLVSISFSIIKHDEIVQSEMTEK